MCCGQYSRGASSSLLSVFLMNIGLDPVHNTSLIAACLSAMQQLDASEPEAIQQQRHRSIGPCSEDVFGEDTGRAVYLMSKSKAQLGRAVMLHAALTSQKCQAALPEHLPHPEAECDLIHELPPCVEALLHTTSESQVRGPASSTPFLTCLSMSCTCSTFKSVDERSPGSPLKHALSICLLAPTGHVRRAEGGGCTESNGAGSSFEHVT